MLPSRYLLLGMCFFFFSCEKTPPPSSPPNLVLIFCDDLGYGDIGPFGAKQHRTPFLDQMAQEGALFTDFYVSSGVCTPSRSSLMTGCYPRRVDLHVNARPKGSVGRQVLFPNAHKGLNPSEYTLAELLKDAGYATACVGKWHLGDQTAFLPTKQGFDRYFGIPYSNDMNRDFCPLPLMRDETVIEAPVEQTTLTQRYTEEALAFIRQHQDQPFFLYLPHAMPHNSVYASEAFQGTSANGGFGDAVEELDWSTGQILELLKELGLAENTLVVFTSDNGAAKPFGGSNLPLSGWKGSTQEGGMRVPALAWWPETIEAGTKISALTTSMDLFPTMAELTQQDIPAEREIDGESILPLLTGEEKESPHEAFFYYQLEQLQAVRSGPWKLHLPLDSMYQNIHRGTWREGRPMKLVNLETDLAETTDLSTEHPEIVQQLLIFAGEAQSKLGDLGKAGHKQRKAAYVAEPIPQLLPPADL
ncbi:MAG: sulfatase [Bacteroidota bacterium]